MHPESRFIAFSLIVSVLAAFAMITNESLWIDEVQTAQFVQRKTFKDWAEALLDSHKSEAQMPVGMLVAWGGGRILGGSEWQLRSLNVLWVGLAGIAIGLTGRRLQRPELLLLFLVHPFLVYYANEARPYALQICAGAWMLYILVRLHTEPAISPGLVWLFGLVAVVGFAANMLFGFLVAGFTVALLVHWLSNRSKYQLRKAHWVPLGLTCVVLALMSVYFLWTIKRGAAGAKIWQLSPFNVAFSLYEGLGFSGLGPARQHLREMGRNPSELISGLTEARYLIGLGILALVCGVVFFRLWKLRRDPLARLLFVTVAATVVVLCAACVIVRFPFWGRHLSPVLPFVILLIALALRPQPASPAPLSNRILLGALIMCWLGSSLSLRFSPEHRKDDYRTAAQTAGEFVSSGHVVWWSADSDAAKYYGLIPERFQSGHGKLLICDRKGAEEVAGYAEPDVIFVSKPDIYDPQGLVRAYRDRQRYVLASRFPAFTVWERNNDAPEGN